MECGYSHLQPVYRARAGRGRQAPQVCRGALHDPVSARAQGFPLPVITGGDMRHMGYVPHINQCLSFSVFSALRALSQATYSSMMRANSFRIGYSQSGTPSSSNAPRLMICSRFADAIVSMK